MKKELVSGLWLLKAKEKIAFTVTSRVPGRILEFNSDLSHSYVQRLPHGIPCLYEMMLRKI